ncbi:hypothetical protein HH214_09635 [Mucilaginibacter robiniae]|uniref:Uncharacterized protein n=1 Tax=Mucilaginibacter robiniae TaxID=2728022 RepID=A0A7L5E162_9SPHI|nr:hypothetical protein [Mucilaginibacter robiniae]QJD96117.1 hypothetical protein HH214_09635 [Mucilaginibacter robiniae]
MWIRGDGNVGIGIDDPQAKLAVNGMIRSKEVKVETANFPDYVFKSSYRLPSLEEVKTYIDKNKHLPEVPAAAEVEKEGMNLGEMNKVLLKKVEELTLYLIQQRKLMECQQLQINKLANKLRKR